MMVYVKLYGTAVALGLALGVAQAAEPSGSWNLKAPLPAGRAEVGVAALDGKVYVVGGTLQSGPGAPVWNSTLNTQYDPARDQWQERAPLPQGLTHVGVAALGGKLYAIGGFTTIVHMGPKDVAFAYDPKTNAWSALPKLSSERGSVAVVAVQGKLHVFGGRTSEKVVKIPSPPGAPDMYAGFGTVATHEIYDPTTRQWSNGTPVPGPTRDHMGIAVIDEKIHLFGGRTSDVVDNLDRHDVYDPKTDVWTTAPPLPVPRSAGAFTVLKGIIIYAGGECKPGGQPFTPNAYDTVTGYDHKTQRWIDLKPLPQARHAFGAATVNDTAYFIGGAPVCGGGTLTDTLAFTR